MGWSRRGAGSPGGPRGRRRAAQASPRGASGLATGGSAGRVPWQENAGRSPEPRPLRGTGLFPIDPSFQALLFPFLQNNLKKSSFQPHVWPLICSRLRVHFSVSVHLVYLRVSHLSLFPALQRKLLHGTTWGLVTCPSSQFWAKEIPRGPLRGRGSTRAGLQTWPCRNSTSWPTSCVTSGKFLSVLQPPLLQNGV